MSKINELIVYGVPSFTGKRQQADIPTPGPNEVLIKVIAAGLNPKDWKFTKRHDEDRALNPSDDIAGIIDYRKGDVAKTILATLDGKPLAHALDAVSAKGSHEVISEVLSATGGGEINMLDPVEDQNCKWPDNVKLSLTFVASAYYTKHAYISQEQADADGDFAFFFYRYISHLLATGKFKPHPHEVLPNGLDGVVDSIQSLHDGKVSAKKLVVRIADTPGL